jgi:hypothetical protein
VPVTDTRNLRAARLAHNSLFTCNVEAIQNRTFRCLGRRGSGVQIAPTRPNLFCFQRYVYKTAHLPQVQRTAGVRTENVGLIDRTASKNQCKWCRVSTILITRAWGVARFCSPASCTAGQSRSDANSFYRLWAPKNLNHERAEFLADPPIRIRFACRPSCA